MRAPIHLRVRVGDVAERVLMAGDPARVRQVSEMLENPRLINENRGLLAYTGVYKGVPLTVVTHGLGAPSALIVLEELIMTGGKYFIRLGTTGALLKGLRIGDLVVPTGAAYYPGGLHYQYCGEYVCGPSTPDFNLLRNLVDAAEQHGVRFHLGPVLSSDAFYAEDPAFAERWSSRGIISVEMECASIFNLSLMRGVKAAGLLVVSNSLVEDLGHATADELKRHVGRAATVAMDALISADG
ncbi:MAG: purine-nucleoside phosphorylase [Zestosphaera sp.]